MSALGRILDTLPPPYAIEDDAILPRFLDAFAIELDALQEDLDLMRRTHWIDFATRLVDLDRLGALVDVERLPWETRESYRPRLLAIVAAQLNGALAPDDVKRLVFEYLTHAQEALHSTFVPGVAGLTAEQAFRPDDERPGFRPLELAENPPRRRRSSALRARGGRVPYLFRWQERNGGLEHTLATFAITGLPQQATAVPLMANLTTRDVIGYSGALKFGARVEIEPAGDAAQPRRARATLNGADVTDRLFSVSGFQLGVPFEPTDFDAQPLLPRMVRGFNDWIYLTVGQFDVRGLDHVAFAIAGEDLREGVFDRTDFDASLFPTGDVARLEMEWDELEPASFEVRVPRHLVIEAPELAGFPDGPVYDRLADALSAAVGRIRAAGVRADVRFVGFRETHAQSVRVTLPWVTLDRDFGSAGTRDRVSLSARFGESPLGEARFQ